jgi:hypothetical protein
MKRLIIVFTAFIVPLWLVAQQTSGGQTATIKITNIHVDLNGEKVPWDKTCEVTLEDGVQTNITIFEEEGLQYGTQFTYKKGKNRLKLVRRGYALKAGKETQYAKQKKDMQEMRTSIPGNLSKRVVDNIVLDKESLEALNVSFNYELIYK